MDNNSFSPYLNSLPLGIVLIINHRRRLARRTLKATEFKEDGLEKRYRGWLVALTTGNIPATGLVSHRHLYISRISIQE